MAKKSRLLENALIGLGGLAMMASPALAEVKGDGYQNPIHFNGNKAKTQITAPASQQVRGQDIVTYNDSRMGCGPSVGDEVDTINGVEVRARAPGSEMFSDRVRDIRGLSNLSDKKIYGLPTSCNGENDKFRISQMFVNKDSQFEYLLPLDEREFPAFFDTNGDMLHDVYGYQENGSGLRVDPNGANWENWKIALSSLNLFAHGDSFEDNMFSNYMLSLIEEDANGVRGLHEFLQNEDIPFKKFVAGDDVTLASNENEGRYIRFSDFVRSYMNAVVVENSANHLKDSLTVSSKGGGLEMGLAKSAVGDLESTDYLTKTAGWFIPLGYNTWQSHRTRGRDSFVDGNVEDVMDSVYDKFRGDYKGFKSDPQAFLSELDNSVSEKLDVLYGGSQK